MNVLGRLVTQITHVNGVPALGLTIVGPKRHARVYVPLRGYLTEGESRASYAARLRHAHRLLWEAYRG